MRSIEKKKKKSDLNHVSHVLDVLCQLLQFFVFTLELYYLLVSGLNVFVQLVLRDESFKTWGILKLYERVDNAQ